MLLHFIHWWPTVLLLPSPTGPGCLFSHLCLPNTSHSQDQDSIVFLSWILLRQPHWERISVSGQLQLQPDVYVASKFNLHSVISSCMWASTFHSGRQNWSGKHLHLSWRQPKWVDHSPPVMIQSLWWWRQPLSRWFPFSVCIQLQSLRGGRKDKLQLLFHFIFYVLNCVTYILGHNYKSLNFIGVKRELYSFK